MPFVKYILNNSKNFTILNPVKFFRRLWRYCFWIKSVPVIFRQAKILLHTVWKSIHKSQGGKTKAPERAPCKRKHSIDLWLALLYWSFTLHFIFHSFAFNFFYFRHIKQYSHLRMTVGSKIILQIVAFYGIPQEDSWPVDPQCHLPSLSSLSDYFRS